MNTLADIAAQLQAYDPNALTVAGVHDFLNALVQPVTETELIDLFDAPERVLAEDVISPISVPPHDNSAMDGFAFDGGALQKGEPLTLRCVGTALAGQAWSGSVAAGECVKIMTGAIMPKGLDTVVPQELTRVDGDMVFIPPDTLRRGDNRRLLGEDLMAGQPALRAGTRLSPSACGLLASLGLPQIRVFRRLKVAYFSTGDEILTLGEAPREGAVYDSNRHTVRALLKRLGCDVIDLGVVGDDPVALREAFTRAAAQADAVITSGGVSVGEADHTKQLMKQLGDVAFWRIAMRPGRPMAVGKLPRQAVSASKDASDAKGKDCYKNDSNLCPVPDHALSHDTILFGLPGNPVAVMVTFLAFVRPALLRMMGVSAAQAEATPMLKARSAEVLRKKPGRTEYQRGIVFTDADGALSVRTTGNQGSGVLRSMAEANGLIVLHHDQGTAQVGDWVNVMVFDGVM